MDTTRWSGLAVDDVTASASTVSAVAVERKTSNECGVDALPYVHIITQALRSIASVMFCSPINASDVQSWYKLPNMETVQELPNMSTFQVISDICKIWN